MSISVVGVRKCIENEFHGNQEAYGISIGMLIRNYKFYALIYIYYACIIDIIL